MHSLRCEFHLRTFFCDLFSTELSATPVSFTFLVGPPSAVIGGTIISISSGLVDSFSTVVVDDTDTLQWKECQPYSGASCLLLQCVSHCCCCTVPSILCVELHTLLWLTCFTYDSPALSLGLVSTEIQHADCFFDVVFICLLQYRICTVHCIVHCNRSEPKYSSILYIDW